MKPSSRLARMFGAALIVAMTAPAAQALTPAHFWSQRFGGISTDQGYAIAVDFSGNVILAGQFAGTADFGGGNLVTDGSTDVFVAKYNSAGVHQWSQRFGSTSNDFMEGVATDVSGNVIIVGGFGGTVSFGGGNLVSAGGNDIFVAKYNSAGTHQWSKGFGGSGSDFASAVATDASSNVFVTGAFTGLATLGSGLAISAGGADIFVEKFNSAGTNQWTKVMGSTSHDYGHSLALDATNSPVVGGSFQATVDFGGGNLVSAGGEDAFLVKYSTTGTHQWSQRFGGTSGDRSLGIATDASSNVVLLGYFQGTADFGGGNLVSAGSTDLFLAKYNAAGAHVWSQRFGGTAIDSPNDIDIDDDGYIVTTGYFGGVADFGGGLLPHGGGNDIFIARYDAAGAHVWSQGFGSGNTEQGRGIAADAAGNVYMTGMFTGTTDFGGGAFTSAGSYDVILAKYSAETAEPQIASVADIGNDQGRQVEIRFARSAHDQSLSPTPILEYEAYRRADATPSALVAWRDPAGLSGRELRADGWTFVGSAPAHFEATYGIVVPTLGDSTLTLGQYHSVFYIRAATSYPGAFFDSPADSGYSLDNLAPAVPQNFAYAAGDLSWDESPATDFDFFTVYGTNTDLFATATVVDYTVAPTLDVTASPYTYYFVTATDFSGNEGKPARVATISGVGGTPRNYVLSVSNYPNPFNPSTTVRYTVPSRGAVSISIYDTRGALVATLFNGDRSAGAYTIGWDGRGQSGTPVSTGVYFARIEHASGTRTKKMLLLK